jgi:hypothetical protein
MPGAVAARESQMVESTDRVNLPLAALTLISQNEISETSRFDSRPHLSSSLTASALIRSVSPSRYQSQIWVSRRSWPL